MKHVLVTGGAGYIGSHACKALAAAGYVPVTYDNLVYGHRSAVRGEERTSILFGRDDERGPARPAPVRRGVAAFAAGVEGQRSRCAGKIS